MKSDTWRKEMKTKTKKEWKQKGWIDHGLTRNTTKPQKKKPKNYKPPKTFEEALNDPYFR